VFSGPGAFAEADGRLAALQFPLCFSGPVWQRIGPFSYSHCPQNVSTGCSVNRS
jgi:hypothetical protein